MIIFYSFPNFQIQLNNDGQNVLSYAESRDHILLFSSFLFRLWKRTNPNKSILYICYVLYENKNFNEKRKTAKKPIRWRRPISQKFYEFKLVSFSTFWYIWIYIYLSNTEVFANNNIFNCILLYQYYYYDYQL